MATIVPEAGRFAEVFELLSGLVTDPRRDIGSTMDTGAMGLVVSDEVYDRYLAEVGGEAPKRRGGRPRKNLADQEEQS